MYEAREIIYKQHPTAPPKKKNQQQPWNKFEKTSKNGFESPKKGKQTYNTFSLESGYQSWKKVSPQNSFNKSRMCFWALCLLQDLWYCL